MDMEREIKIPNETGEPPLPEELIREQAQSQQPPPEPEKTEAGEPEPPPAEQGPPPAESAPPKFFEQSVAPIAQHRLASAVPPERIPPPPPLDHERYLTDPAYAKSYMEAISLYQAAVAEATRKQIEARLARYEMASLGPAVNRAFAQGVSPFLEGFQTDAEKDQLARAVIEARNAAVAAGDLQRMADPSFWAAVAAAAAARTGVLFRQSAARGEARRFHGQPARTFSTSGSPGSAAAFAGGRQYELSDEERRLAAEFGISEEEWVKNMMEGT